MVTICCIKWGTKYGPEYVNNLYRMVERNTTVPHDFVCFTENIEGILSEIRTAPLVCEHPYWWQKVGLFKAEIPGVHTEKILFLDLDVVITGSIDRILEMDSDFAIARNFPEPDCMDYWSSAILLRVGSQRQVWDLFDISKVPQGYDNDGDQVWITNAAPGADFFPYDWMPSYKIRKLQSGYPQDASIVMFHGRPAPHECDGWVKQMWR